MSKQVKRLYRQFSPTHYDVVIKLSEDKKSFSGHVTVTGERRYKPSSRITLHQKGLKISNPKITYTDKKGDSSPVNIERTVNHKAYDELRFHSDIQLKSGKYKLSMDFEGKITINMDGVYPCFFTVDGTKKRLIATQFESHHAREAFPCIDEPEAKATFQLTLEHDTVETAISNTMPVEEKAKDGRTTTVFGKTPVMSTYLLAFVVGEMKSKIAKSKSGVTIRTFATENQIENTEFALGEAVKYMDFYEEYYDIRYPLEKCDYVALPDFASGAMENWGLLTFREQALLVDEKLSSLYSKQYVSLVVAHETTHQWFGNLVTMQWWTDLWLNEGFASWMEYLALDNLHPEWKMWTQFAVDDQQIALKMDALEHTHPVEVEVKHPDEIRSIFDVISYSKGASVIHMLNDYLGADDFREGIRQYLKKFSYKNTTTIDLWQALEDTSGKPVKSFMHCWTATPGFPLVSIADGGDHIKVAQSRFVTNPLSDARNDRTAWPVPLLVDGVETSIVDKASVNIPIKKGDEAPLKINLGQTGFYRVDYDNAIQERQIEQIKSGKMNDLDRMGLLSDGFEVTKAGYQPVTDLLDLMAHYRNEDTLPVWEVMSSVVGSIRSTLSETDHSNTLRDAMKPFINQLVAQQLDRLGIEEINDEPHLDTLLRPLIVGLAATADNEKVVEYLLSEYRQKIDGNKAINPNIRGSIYSTAARKGDEKVFNELLNLYKKTLSSDEKLSITAAMTSFEQPELHDKTLDLIKSGTIKLQDISYWIAYSLMNRHSRQVTWKWIKTNWPWLKQNIGSDLSFSRFPLYSGRVFTTDESIEDYKKFYTTNMEPMLKRTYAQGLEVATTNQQWHKRDTEAALDWFNSQNISNQ